MPESSASLLAWAICVLSMFTPTTDALAHVAAFRAMSPRPLPVSSNRSPAFVNQYRVTLVVEYLGWVDLDFGCSTILLGQ